MLLIYYISQLISSYTTTMDSQQIFFINLKEDFKEEESELRGVKGDSEIEDDTGLSELPSEEFGRDSTLLRKFDGVNAKDSSGLKSGPKKILTPLEFVGVSNFCGV